MLAANAGQIYKTVLKVLIIACMIKEIPSFYGIQYFIITFIRFCH
jgi:hypothetical protein